MGMMVIMVLMGIATVYKGVNAEAKGGDKGVNAEARRKIKT